jgi:hypothetical protein
VRIVHEGERWRLEEEVENEVVETVKKIGHSEFGTLARQAINHIKSTLA